jgi:hypothetical protein
MFLLIKIFPTSLVFIFTNPIRSDMNIIHKNRESLLCGVQHYHKFNTWQKLEILWFFNLYSLFCKILGCIAFYLLHSSVCKITGIFSFSLVASFFLLFITECNCFFPISYSGLDALFNLWVCLVHRAKVGAICI